MSNPITIVLVLMGLVASVIGLDLQAAIEGVYIHWDTTAWVTMGLVHLAASLVVGFGFTALRR